MTYSYNNETDSDSQPRFIAMSLVAVVFVLIAILLIKAFIRNRPLIVPSPTSYVSFRAPDNSYKIDVPSKWKTQFHQQQFFDNHLAEFYTEGAGIFVQDDTESSLRDKVTPDSIDASSTQDPFLKRMQTSTDRLAKSSGEAPLKRVPNETPLYYQHQLARYEWEMQLGNLHEDDPLPITTPLGLGYVSVWHQPPNRRSKYGCGWRGYRATFLTQARRVTIFCSGPDTSWKTLQPAYLRVINSISPATP